MVAATGYGGDKILSRRRRGDVDVGGLAAAAATAASGSVAVTAAFFQTDGVIQLKNSAARARITTIQSGAATSVADAPTSAAAVALATRMRRESDSDQRVQNE